MSFEIKKRAQNVTFVHYVAHTVEKVVGWHSTEMPSCSQM